MRSSSLSTLVLLSSGALAAQWNGVIPRALTSRADQSFTPGQTQGQGSTCKEAFGGGSRLCADSEVCYDPTIGDSCCKEGYPCPAGSFCLTKGLCCPDGVDPKTCASDNGIELPADFGKTTSAATTAATETTASVQVTSSPTTLSTSPPFPIPTKASAPAPSGSGAAAGTASGGAASPASTVTPYLGAASSVQISSALLGGFLAVAALMGVVAL